MATLRAVLVLALVVAGGCIATAGAAYPFATSATSGCSRFLVQGVSQWTVRLSEVDEGGCVRSGKENVLSWGEGLQVARIGAPFVSALVMDFQPVRDWPDEHLVAHTMYHSLLAVPSHVSVAVASHASEPIPADQRVANGEFANQAFAKTVSHGNQFNT